MAVNLQFGLLGPLQVHRSEVAVPVPEGRQRALLAALLLNAGLVVPVDELADILWGELTPPSARASLQNHLRLRKSLGHAGYELIKTAPPGYVISVAPGDLDVSRFETLLGAARAAARGGSWDTAAGRARAALAVWRGAPLADVESEVLAQREVPRLAEMRLQAAETWSIKGLPPNPVAWLYTVAKNKAKK